MSYAFPARPLRLKVACPLIFFIAHRVVSFLRQKIETDRLLVVNRIVNSDGDGDKGKLNVAFPY